MARSWQETASQQAEHIANRVRELLSSGLVFLHSELGVDLELRPDLYPQWAILLTASICLLLLMVLWVSIFRVIFQQRSRRPSVTEETVEISKEPVKPIKADEPKKRNKKKHSEKKSQSNGRATTDLQEEAEVATGIQSEESPEVRCDKIKKSKKSKVKPVVKKTKSATSTDGKEPDEGDWETKVSNREKKQQRRKDKTASDGSASPGGADLPVSPPPSEQPKPNTSAPAGQRKSKAEPSKVKVEKADAPAIPQVTPSWDEMLVGSDVGWNAQTLQLSAQMTTADSENWTTITQPPEPRNPEPTVWPQEMEGSWTIVDGIQNPASFTGLTVTSAREFQTLPDLSWACEPAVDDEWSGLNGMASRDTATDWNAPSEEWGNYEEPQQESPAAEVQHVSEEMQGSDDEKEKVDTSAPGSGKAKKKKKKKKKVEDAGPTTQEEAERDVRLVVSNQPVAPAATLTETQGAVSQAASTPVPQRVTEAKAPAKKNSATAPTQIAKPEETTESPKQVKKKKARRET